MEPMSKPTDQSEEKYRDGTAQFFDEFAALNNELATAHRELAKTNAELRTLSAQKNLFLGMVAHDLRNPLGVIRAYSEFVEESAEDRLNEEESKLLKVVANLSEFMLSIVNDLLDLAKIESGAIELNLAPLATGPWLTELIDLNSVFARKKNITITLKEEGVIPTILADENKLMQVVNNLLGNATKYSHRDGVIEVRLASDSEWLHLSVLDHGVGIKQEDLQSILDPFKTARLRGESGEKSTGLGLAIVKRIIDAHGGRLEIASTLGEGTIFRASLPLNVI